MDASTTTAAHESVEELGERIAVLVGERQALREAAAPPGALEENRRQIADLQQRLSDALIARHLPLVP